MTDQVPGKSTLRTDVPPYERDDVPPGSKEDQERKAKKAELEKSGGKPVKGAKAAKEKAATATKDQPRRAKRPAGNAATQTVPAGALAQRQQQPAVCTGGIDDRRRIAPRGRGNCSLASANFEVLTCGSPSARGSIRARERDQRVTSPARRPERSRPGAVELWRVVADRQHLAVKDIDAFPRLAAQGPRRVVEIDGRGLCARVQPEGSGVERLPVLGSDLELVARKGEAMTDKVAGGFAVVVRLGRESRRLAASAGRHRPVGRRREQVRVTRITPAHIAEVSRCIVLLRCWSATVRYGAAAGGRVARRGYRKISLDSVTLVR